MDGRIRGNGAQPVHGPADLLTEVPMSLHDILSFARWRLKPVRKAAKRINQLRVPGSSIPRLHSNHLPEYENFYRLGYIRHSDFAAPDIDLGELSGTANGASFVDVSHKYRAEVDHAFLTLIRDPYIAGLVNSYFDGSPWLWNLALNYSDPSSERLDSQFWHFDYGDDRQIHIMAYFSDVSEDSGPFTFFNAEQSIQVNRNRFVIERLDDPDIAKFGLGGSVHPTKLIGPKGSVWIADPGRLLHQGARCATPRLVMFASFTSRAPMSYGGGSTISSARRRELGEAYFGRESSPLSASAFAT